MGALWFSQVCRSHLLRHIHFRQNNSEAKLARPLSDKQYASEAKSGRSQNYFGHLFALLFLSNLFSIDDATSSRAAPLSQVLLHRFTKAVPRLVGPL